MEYQRPQNPYQQNGQAPYQPNPQNAYQPNPQNVYRQNPQAAYPQNAYAAPQPNYQNVQIPPQYKPLSPWAYLGYDLLFSIPLVGFILLIVFSFSDENINRRNYARSFFCVLLIAVILFVIILVLGLAFGFADTVFGGSRYYY